MQCDSCGAEARYASPDGKSTYCGLQCHHKPWDYATQSFGGFMVNTNVLHYDSMTLNMFPPRPDVTRAKIDAAFWAMEQAKDRPDDYPWNGGCVMSLNGSRDSYTLHYKDGSVRDLDPRTFALEDHLFQIKEWTLSKT